MNNYNTITSAFNGTKAVLTTGTHQEGDSPVVRGYKSVANVASFVLRKTIRAPFLLKNLFNKKDSIKNSPSLAQQEVVVDPLKGSNPLIEDISQSLKETVILYKKFTSKSGDLAEKTEKIVNQVGFSIDNLPSLKKVDFGKLLDSSLRVTQKFFPKEFLILTGRKETEKEITKKLKSLLACLQHLEIPNELSKAFTLSGVDSMTEQLKLIDKGVEAFVAKETNLPEDVCCMLVNAFKSISELQSLLKEYKKDVDRPIDRKDGIFAKNIIEKNPLVIKIISPTVIAVGSVLTPFMTIDYMPYMVSKMIDLFVHSFHGIPSLMPVLQNATVTTAFCALTAVNYTNEEEQEGYSTYIINTLVNQVSTLTNQVFMCAFAYVGARMCGSETKIKGFVEQRISSVLAYKTCNCSLDYLGISFWLNKAASSIVSGCTSRMLNLFEKDNSLKKQNLT